MNRPEDTVLCIVCGEPFSPVDSDTVICPSCTGPKARPVETAAQDEPRIFRTRHELQEPVGTRLQPHTAPPPPAFTGEDRILKPNSTILGLYEVQALLGEGGMGSVYRARHSKWGIDLAIKVPKIKDDAALQEKFIREAEAWIDLGLHPHTVSCFYVRRMDKQLLIFAECVTGGGLDAWIREGRLDSLDKILDLAAQFVWGLGHAHARGLVHKDVKPGNVLLAPDGTLKVNDFGLAGSIGGYTLPFASPEQLLGQTPTHKTDIWSWALSLLQMFNGDLTWRDGTVATAVLESYRMQGPAVRGTPPMPMDIYMLLQECFENDPESRPESMDVIGDRLVRIFERHTGKPYARNKPQAADLRADSLNNRALSLLDLDREEEAVSMWQAALQEDPGHTQANLNLAAWRWHRAEITDDEMLAQLDQVEGQRQDDAPRWFGLGCLHAERGDGDTADEDFRQAARIDPSLTPPKDRNTLSAGRTLAGHNQSIYALARTQDGRLASGSADGTIRIWDLSRGRQTDVFENAGFVTSIAFSPDGSWMASGSSDQTVRIWDVRRKKCIRQLKGHRDVATSVAFSPDSAQVISGSLDGSARVWDRKSGRCLQEYGEHGTWVLSLAPIPGEDLVLSAGRDQLVRLWQPSTGRTLRVFERPRSPRKAEYGSVSYAGRRVLWAGYDRMALWDFESGELLRIFRSCEDSTAINPFVDGELSPDGRLAVTAGREGQVRLWDTASGRCIHTIATGGDVWRVLFATPDTLATGRGPEIQLWTFRIDPALESYQPALSLPESGTEALEKQSKLAECLSLADSHLRAGRARQALAVLRTFQGEPGFAHNDALLSLAAHCGQGRRRTALREMWRRASFNLGEHEGIGGATAVRFSPSGGTLVAGHHEGTVGVYDVKDNAARHKLDRLIGPVESFVFLDEEDLLAFSRNGDLVRWDLASGRGQTLQTGLDPNKGAHLSVVLAEDGGYVVVIGLKGFTRQPVHLSSGVPLRERPFSSRVLRAKFDLGVPKVMDGMYAGYDFHAAASPDSRFYTTSIMNGTFGRGAHPVYVWEVQGRSVSIAATLLGHTSPVLSMTFAPGGKILASADIGGNLRIWRLQDGRCIHTIRQPGSQFTAVAFSADSNRVMAGDSEGRLFLWDMDENFLAGNHSHSGAVNTVAFSVDDRFAASAGYDNNVMLWEFDWDYDF